MTTSRPPIHQPTTTPRPARSAWPLLAITLTAALLLPGCPLFRDLEEVQLLDAAAPQPDATADMPPTVDMPPDMLPPADMPPDMPVADMPPDMPLTVDMAPDMPPTVDMAPDMPPTVDMPPDMPPPPAELTCDHLGDPTVHSCDPVEPKPFCGTDDARCGMVVFFSGNMPSLGTTCKPLDKFDPTGVPGANCTSDSQCAVGTSCVNWRAWDPLVLRPARHVCSTICELATGLGCGPGEFCVQYDPDLEGLGACYPSCDPLDATSCQQFPGTTCGVDPYVPQRGCQPAFSCRDGMSNRTKSLGDGCNFRLTDSGCPTGTICYPLTDDQVTLTDSTAGTCVVPCDEDSDCASFAPASTCGAEEQGFWDIRICVDSSTTMP